MLTAGMIFDRPHLWASEALKCPLGIGTSLWYTCDEDWYRLQEGLSTSIQTAPLIHGMVYTAANEHTTSRFRMDLIEDDVLNATVWSAVVQCFRIGAYHRTLSFIPSDASFLILIRTPMKLSDPISSAEQRRLDALDTITSNAKLKRVHVA